MAVQVTYPHSEQTGSPKQLSLPQIWAVATRSGRSYGPSHASGTCRWNDVPRLGRMAINEVRSRSTGISSTPLSITPASPSWA